MRYPRFVVAFLSLLVTLSPSVSAWNATGHRLIAAIAYDRLNPKTRARVDELIRRHPDYEKLFLQGAPTEPKARARAAFIAASVWADQIKGDPRFYDETRPNASPTPLLPGFPDMARHTVWHYYDTPYAPDGAAIEQQKPPHALSELKRIIPLIGNKADVPPTSASNPVYLLPWLEHIEGDVHQPLHCVSRFLKSQPKGDQGGNLVYIGTRNLHSIWDGAAGQDTTDAYAAKYIAEAIAAHPAPRRTEKKPEKWIDEGFRLAVSDVYTFGNETGTRDKPLPLPPGYLDHAAKVAQGQIARAGYRLAAVLNDKLK
ncbi:MAG TPA: S1/P1 nuclease [Bryobacteraceae bacterium]|nr:S1/P1 nuclease [Bryobacteraceae bacterium]